MKRFLLVVALCALSGSAQASEIGQSRNVGLGLALGGPSGVSLKIFADRMHAFDFTLGLGFFGGPGLSVHGDYKVHLFEITRTSAFDLPFYVGIGAKLRVWFDEGPRSYIGSDARTGAIGLGARVPVGVAFHLNKVPLDVFVEVAPGLGVLPGVGLFIDGSAGVRYWF